MLQECERVNTLLTTLRISLNECGAGLRGRLTVSESMERVLHALDHGQVPSEWAVVAYPSLRALRPWVEDLGLRVKQMESWANDFVLPRSVWISGLFNPMSFLTAVMQTTARKGGQALDQMVSTGEWGREVQMRFPPTPKDSIKIHRASTQWLRATCLGTFSHPIPLFLSSSLSPFMLFSFSASVKSKHIMAFFAAPSRPLEEGAGFCSFA